MYVILSECTFMYVSVSMIYIYFRTYIIFLLKMQKQLIQPFSEITYIYYIATEVTFPGTMVPKNLCLKKKYVIFLNQCPQNLSINV